MKRLTPRRELVVLCYGNICRSPLAEVLLREAIGEAGMGEEIRVSSAGFLGDGHPAHPFMRQLAKRRGLSLEEHASRLLTPMGIHRSWILLAAEESLAERARRLGAEHAYNLAPWATLGEDQTDIEDPMGRELAEFEACAARLDALVPRVVERLRFEIEKSTKTEGTPS